MNEKNRKRERKRARKEHIAKHGAPHPLHPRHWPLWLLFGIGWCVARLPFPLQVKLGKGFGHLLAVVGKSRAHVARRNIEICFPHLTEQERKKLLQDNFESVGLGFVEIAMAYWGSKEKLHSILTFSGREHLEAARAAGKGVLILGGHVTSLELMLRLFCESWPSGALYKPNHNPFFEDYSVRKRTRYVHPPIPNKNVRGFLRHLKNGGTCIYLSDQDYGRKNSVFAPFFGVPAATIKYPPDYVRATGALVMPVIYGRRPDDSGYYIEVMPPLDFPSGDDVQDATTLNHWIEQNVLRHPDQYLWAHRRFKNRPAGEPPLY